jgi:hypothetical protein
VCCETTAFAGCSSVELGYGVCFWAAVVDPKRKFVSPQLPPGWSGYRGGSALLRILIPEVPEVLQNTRN